MQTTFHCFSSSSLPTQLPSAISILYKLGLIWHVCAYKCTFKVTSRYSLPLKTYSETFHSLSQPIYFSSSFHTCHSSAPTVANRLLLLLFTGIFPLPPSPTSSHFPSPYTLPPPLKLQPSTSPPPTLTHLPSSYTHPPPLPSLPPYSHVAESVSSSIFCPPQLRANR